MQYQNFSDLVNAMGDPKYMNNDITGENAKKLAEFYSYWSNYLEPTPAFLAFLASLPGGIAKALYQITASLEHVFNNMFKLFGLFGYLGDTNTVIGQFFYWFQVIGSALFTLFLVTSAITRVFTKPVKYKGVITNFLLVTLVTAVLPLALTSVSSAIAQDAMAIQTVSSRDKDGNTHYSSLAIQPMKNNVVDLKVLVDNDFSTELFPMDNYGYIKPVQEGSTPVNNITDDTSKRDTVDFATRIDFGATYGAANSVVLDEMTKRNGQGDVGLKGLFLHKLDSNQTGVETITEHRFVKGLNAFESVYLRYKVNWIGMFMQYGILIVLLISMSIKFVKSVFDIVIEAMISPLQGYSSLSNSKKYKELLQTMGGAIAGIFFEVVIMRVTLEICRDLPTLSVSAVTKLSGGFFDGLNMWEQCLAASLVYIGIFFAAMQGVSMIERWLGVSTGHSDTAQQLLGAMMMGNAFATGAGALGQGALAAGQFGMDMAKKAPGAIASGSKVIGDSLAVTGGGIKGMVDSAKDQGAMNAVKGGVSNMVDLADVMGQEAIGKAKDFVGDVTDHLGAKAQGAHDAVYNGLKNDAIPDRAANAGLFGGGDYTLNPSGHYGGEQLFQDGADGGLSDSLDSGPVGGGVSDPSLSMPNTTVDSEPFSGVTDPSQNQAPHITRNEEMAPNPTAPKITPEVPKQPSSARNNLQQSMNKMNYMSQQMQQAGQRMQGQNHIRGAEIDESEE